jgi:segregation and condensation protein B
MSVDQLTQAFANLMGEGKPQSPSATSPAAGAAESVGELSDPSLDALHDDGDERPATPESILEAILFLGHPQNQPISSRVIASYLRGVSPQEVDQMVATLNDQYAEQGSAYEIKSVGTGYRMALRDEFVRLREVFYGRIREAKLTQAAVDLLAIVAYHQPIAAETVDRLRGQPSGAVLSQLVRRELLRVEMTKEKPRKKLYRTTDRFLDLFGLESLEDLPNHEDF